MCADIKRKRKTKNFGAAMNMEQAQRYLVVGYRVMKRIVASGELPFRKVGSRMYFSRELLDRWLNFDVEPSRSEK